MTTSTLSLLDQTELMHLSREATLRGDGAAALAYLKEAVSRPDATAVAHYMLGAEYAEITMYDRAVEEMEAAVALDPGLSIARLQLGLLWLTSGVADRALGVLEPLMELPQTDPLRHFGAGLCALIGDRFDESVSALQAGMVLNDSNAPLNGDMQKIIDAIAKLREDAANAAPEAAAPADTAAAESGLHVLLSAYTGNTSH